METILTKMRREHHDLLKDKDRGEAFWGRATSFIEKYKEIGKHLWTHEHRLDAQSLLDYWSTSLGRAGYGFS